MDVGLLVVDQRGAVRETDLPGVHGPPQHRRTGIGVQDATRAPRQARVDQLTAKPGGDIDDTVSSGCVGGSIDRPAHTVSVWVDAS